MNSEYNVSIMSKISYKKILKDMRYKPLNLQSTILVFKQVFDRMINIRLNKYLYFTNFLYLFLLYTRFHLLHFLSLTLLLLLL